MLNWNLVFFSFRNPFPLSFGEDSQSRGRTCRIRYEAKWIIQNNARNIPDAIPDATPGQNGVRWNGSSVIEMEMQMKLDWIIIEFLEILL